MTYRTVIEVRAGQRARALPESFERIDEVTPHLRPVLGRAGLGVVSHPLIVLRDTAGPRESAAGTTVRLVDPDRDDLARLQAVMGQSFG